MTVNEKKIYLNRIKAINKITTSKICRDLKVNRSNLENGNASLENTKKVYEQLVKEIEQAIK